MMKGCLWILLLYLVFISVLIIALAILFEYGGLAFIAFCADCVLCRWYGSKLYFGKEG